MADYFFISTFAPANERIVLKIMVGALAQLVEHRTENPCVPGSIPGGTTPPFIMNPAKVFGLSGIFKLIIFKNSFKFIFC